MNQNHGQVNPWKEPHSSLGLEKNLQDILAAHDRVVVDLGRAYPGDLISETFLESYISQGKWFFDLLARVCSFENCKNKLSIRFSDGKTMDLFKQAITGPWELWDSGTTLSFYDSSFRKRKDSSSHPKVELDFTLSLFDILSLIQTERLCEEALGSASLQLTLPLCLWGDVEQIGHHYVDGDQTFAEVFEFVGNAGPRPQLVFVNGPLGQVYSWQELKGQKLKDFGPPIRTLHFFKNKDLKGLFKVWNEYFREDSCHHCLPCLFSRKGMKEDQDAASLKGFAPFQCHYPQLYRKADIFTNLIDETNGRSGGGSL